MDTVELTAKLLFLALLWAVLASPFLVVAFFVGRAMRRRGVTSPLALLSFSLVLAFLLAPIPTPIITVFYPSGLALIGGAFFAHFLSEETYYQGLRPWVATSLIITLAICAVAVPWLIARRKGRE